MSDLEDIVKRLQTAEDLIAIQQLFNRYGNYLDAGEFDKYAELFAEDGELKLGPMGRVTGRAAIAEMMSKQLSASIGQSYHIISNPVIDLDGDTATSEVMWSVIYRGDGEKPVLGMIGRHRDELQRTADGWKFKVRAGYVDIPSKMG